MLTLAIILFAIGVLFGLIVLTSFLRHGVTPKGSVIVHGILILIALILVIVYVTNNKPGPLVAMVMFIITAVFGFALLAIDLSRKPLPRFLVFLHPFLAAISLIVLIIWTVSAH